MALDVVEERAPKRVGPEEHAEPTVSLSELLSFAEKNSPIISVARATRSRADAAKTAASLLLTQNPNFSVALGPRTSQASSALDFELGLEQTIPIAGERGLRMEVAERFGELTETEINQIRWAVHCDVHAAYHRALVELERKRLAERVVEFQDEVLRIVERQIAAGETAPLLLRLAQAEVAQAEQALVGAEQVYLASRIRLAVLAGWPPTSPPVPLGGVEEPKTPPEFFELVRVALEHQPNLRVAEAHLREASARNTLANREAFPRPSLGVQFRREGAVPGSYETNIVLGSLSIAIPSFQLNQGERARSDADRIVAHAEVAASRRLLEGRVAESRSEVVAASQRARAYARTILPRFEENLTLLRRSFELGEIDLLALSAGRERFLRIQSDALLAQLDYFVALSGLERLVGIDLWRDEGEER